MSDNSEIVDFTSRGYRWDPSLTAVPYSFSVSSQKITVLGSQSRPTRWFYFLGHWGDASFESGDERQEIVAGQKAWSDGPTFTIKKNLERVKVTLSACCVFHATELIRIASQQQVLVQCRPDSKSRLESGVLEIATTKIPKR